MSKEIMITYSTASLITAVMETYPQELHLRPLSEQHCATQDSQQ